MHSKSTQVKSSHLSGKRRQALQVAFNSFKKTRLSDFWALWARQLSVKKAQEELEASNALTAKQTAVLAQKVSLHESEIGFDHV